MFYAQPGDDFRTVCLWHDDIAEYQMNLSGILIQNEFRFGLSFRLEGLIPQRSQKS